MLGKTIVMTGATSGIGRVAAEQLAAQGARIVFVARDAARGEATLSRLRQLGPRAEHRVHHADLSSLADMKRVAGEIAAAEPRIDVLANNAGALFGSRQVTRDGLETTFATNHLSYFVLTHGLRERLAAGGARVVNTSSASHRSAPADVEDWQSAKKFSSFGAYSRSKLYNILFTRELARRLAGTGATANAFHPGFVATRFGSGSGPVLAVAVRAAQWFALTPAQGADTLVYLAASPEVATVSGQYFYKRHIAKTTAAARNDELARRLWAESERLTGIRWEANPRG